MIPSQNEILIYELKPGAHATFTYLNPDQRRWRYSVRVNEEGFRGALASPSHAGPRLIVLGDSYAFGYGVEDHETFPHRLGELLGGGVEVLNWSVPGYNLIQQVELLRVRGAAYAPDIVVLTLHPNDIEPPIFTRDELRYARLSHLYSIGLHLRYLSEDMEELLARDRSERVRQAWQAFESLLALGRDWGFELFLFQVSCWDGNDADVVAAFFERCRQRGLRTLGLDRRFCAEFEAFRIPDDLHPTAAGHERLARRLFARLAPALGRRAPSGAP